MLSVLQPCYDPTVAEGALVNSPTIHQIKVTIQEIEPPIWRRFQVTSDLSLIRLHRVLQTVMGWTGSHLYQFIATGAVYGERHCLRTGT